MKLGLDKKNYISLIIFVGISLALIIFVILPLIQGIKEGSQQLLLEEEARVTLSEEIRNFQNFKAVYQEIESDLEKTGGFFAIQEPPIEFINFLEETALNSDVFIEISSVNPGKTEEYPWSFLNFRLQASGSFSNFSRFIEKLEKDSYLIEIYELSLSESAKGSPGTEESVGFPIRNVSASLSLKVFTK